MNLRVHIQATHRTDYVLNFGEYRRVYGNSIGPDHCNDLAAFTLTI